MKTILLSAIALFIMNASAQSDSFKVPKAWDQTFIISIANTNSVKGNSSRLSF